MCCAVVSQTRATARQRSDCCAFAASGKRPDRRAGSSASTHDGCRWLSLRFRTTYRGVREYVRR